MVVNVMTRLSLATSVRGSIRYLRHHTKPLIACKVSSRTHRAVVCQGQKGDGDNVRKSKKGDMFEGANRRKGRPAHLRSPDDSPFRDGNRDRLVGLLTERSVKTLLYYLMETNLNLHYWLIEFYKENPIPRFGSWEDVSGDTFLRKLLSMPIQEAKVQTGLDAMYDMAVPCLVDPRSIAQRIMDIRVQLSKEFTQDLTDITEENSSLLRESLVRSLESTFGATVSAKSQGGVLHPEVSNSPSISTSSSGPAVAPPAPVPINGSSSAKLQGSISTAEPAARPPPAATPLASKGAEEASPSSATVGTTTTAKAEPTTAMPVVLSDKLDSTPGGAVPSSGVAAAAIGKDVQAAAADVAPKVSDTPTEAMAGSCAASPVIMPEEPTPAAPSNNAAFEVTSGAAVTSGATASSETVSLSLDVNDVSGSTVTSITVKGAADTVVPKSNEGASREVVNSMDVKVEAVVNSAQAATATTFTVAASAGATATPVVVAASGIFSPTSSVPETATAMATANSGTVAEVGSAAMGKASVTSVDANGTTATPLPVVADDVRTAATSAEPKVEQVLASAETPEPPK